MPARLLDKAKESNVIATWRESDCLQKKQFQGIKRAISTTNISGKEKKRKQLDMEDEELDDSADGGSTSHFALSSVATGNDACPPTEGMAMRSSNVSSSRKNKCHDNQDSRGSSFEEDGQLGVHGDEGDIHHSSSVANICGQTHTTFEERLAELAAYQAKHGHCYVPTSPSSKYYSLGEWCGKMRGAYKNIQQGKTPSIVLWQDQIDRLEALGFEWSGNNTFDKWFAELAAFKAKHGHCDPPKSPGSKYYLLDQPMTPSSKYCLLNQWCNSIRFSYKRMLQDKSSPTILSKDQIQRVEALGFEWQIRIINTWRSNSRDSYKNIQEGKTLSKESTTPTASTFSKNSTFDKNSTFGIWFAELAAFKAKHGHCNPPRTTPRTRSSKYHLLNQWCNSISFSYKRMLQGKTSTTLLSKDQIERVGALGFEWRVGNTNTWRSNTRGSYSSNTRGSYSLIQEGNTLSEVLTTPTTSTFSERNFHSLLLPQDRQLTTPFTVKVINQLKIVFFEEGDRRNHRMNIALGHAGFACRHCCASPGKAGRYFPSTIKTLADSNKTLYAIHKHLVNRCDHCPHNVKVTLGILLELHPNEKRQFLEGQLPFFRRIWHFLRSRDDNTNAVSC